MKPPLLLILPGALMYIGKMAAHTNLCIAVLLLANIWVPSLCSQVPRWKEIRVEKEGVDNNSCWSHDTLHPTSVVPCRTLLYAFSHVQNYTTIRVGCGTHELEPPNHTQTLLFMNLVEIHIQGFCPGDSVVPVVKCVNGSHLTFQMVTNVTVERLRFHDCRGPSLEDIIKTTVNYYSIHFYICTNVTVQDVELILTVQGNSGGIICFIPLNSVHLSNIYISQLNGWGNAISIDIFHKNVKTFKYQTNISITNVVIRRQGYSLPQSIMPPSDNYGISIQVYMGSHRVSVSKVAIMDSGAYYSSAWGVYVRLLDKAMQNNIMLKHISVVSGWQLESHAALTPLSQVLHYCNNHWTLASDESTEHMIDSSTTAGIRLRVEGPSNSIMVEHCLVSHCRVWPGFAATVSHKLWSWSYEHILNHTYSQALNKVFVPPFRRVGLKITFKGLKTHQNKVSVVKSVFAYNHGELGGGGISVHHYSTGNMVDIKQTTVAFNWAHSGGGVLLYCSVFTPTQYSEVYLEYSHIIGNQAERYGAGMSVTLDDTFTHNCDVSVMHTNIAYNILLQSNIHGRMGGGVHIGQSGRAGFNGGLNRVKVALAAFFHNQAVGGTGGGLSMLYFGHDGRMDGDRIYEYTLEIIGCIFVNNTAAYGQAIALEAVSVGEKRLYNGILIVGTTIQHSNRDLLQTQQAQWQQPFKKDDTKLSTTWHLQELEMQNKLRRSYIPDEEVQILTSGKDLVYMNGVKIEVAQYLFIVCRGSSQGIVAVDAEVHIESESDFRILDCVASHGGGVALLGESYIRISDDVHLEFVNNYAFNRGGAIYANFVHRQANLVATCFLKFDNFESKRLNITFLNNFARMEGHSIYVTDIKICQLSEELFDGFKKYSTGNNAINHIFELSPPFCFIPAGCTSTCEQGTNTSHCSTHGQVVTVPSQVEGSSSMLSQTKAFIPGKETSPLFETVKDDIGNVVSAVFTVQIVPKDSAIKVNPFSNFTSDFRIILHGTPLNQTSIPLTNSSRLHEVATLILQSVDNSNLLALVDIEMECCPPGYIFTDEDGLGTCICAANGVQGLLECKQDTFQAVLEKDHWAGYLQSDSTTPHSCNGLKLFTAPCPPGYCSPSVQLLPQNQSKELLQNLLCAPNNRKGVLCRECMEGHSMPANLNGLNLVCTKCDGVLSRAGIFVWIVSEWIPMLVLLAIMLVFNVDLISGRLNSFLLFAQLLSISNIRGEADIGIWGYTWFVKINRFLYGIWNLEFFGILLPPYCFTPTASISTLQMLLLNYSIGLFPLTVTIVLVVLDRSAEKWICCHPVDRCLRRLRRWKTKVSKEMSYDRALADFVILGFTRFMVTSAFILVKQNITAYDGATESRVWWQGSTHYGSADHIGSLIPAIIIVLIFVLLPSFLPIALPLFPQIVGRLIFYSKIKCVKKFQFIPTFCSNVYTDRWMYHFVNVLQGCYKDRFRCFASFFLFYRIIQLSAVIFTQRAEDALFIQLLTALIFLLLIAACQPYKKKTLNTVDVLITANYALILLLAMHISKESTPLTYKQACSVIQLVLSYLPLLYLAGLVIHKVWVKYPPSQCRKGNNLDNSFNESLLVEDPREGLGGLVNITELRAGLPQDYVTTTDSNDLTDSQQMWEEGASTSM